MFLLHHRNKHKWSQTRLGIYVGYETISIIRYLEPLIGDVFTTRFADRKLDEKYFPLLGREKKRQEKDATSITKLNSYGGGDGVKDLACEGSGVANMGGRYGVCGCIIEVMVVEQGRAVDDDVMFWRW
ncbi:hypothetical protein Tco_1164151 [Tanacetum coccineum]